MKNQCYLKQLSKLLALLSFSSFFAFDVVKLPAQTAFICAGANAISSGGGLSFSTGQVAYTFVSTAAGSNSQGVQQGFKILKVKTLAFNSVVSCQVYPNPVAEQLTLKVLGQTPKELKYLLYDSGGRLLLSGKVRSEEVLISMSELPPATYFLALSLPQSQTTHFQIIKK